MKFMNNKLKIILIFIVVVGLALATGLVIQKFIPKKVIVYNGPTVPPVPINYTNLPQELSKQGIVGAIPSGSEILLKFYNFNSGSRVWEKSYAMTKGSVKEITNVEERADIVLTLNSNYLNSLTNQNFCDVIQKANNNGDLGFGTSLSEVALAWKFKSMYQYRTCLGF